MRPLEYKTIGNQKHLTFDSIRRYVLKELSDLGKEEAHTHIEECSRCKSIEQSLAFPIHNRKSSLRDFYLPKAWRGALALFLIAGTVIAAFLFFKRTPKPPITMDPQRIPAAQNEVANEEESEAAPVLEAIDTLSQIVEEPTVSDPISTTKKFDNYIEQPKNQPQAQVRGIYGKITKDGQPVAGVTVMTPGSSKARVTDASGKYYIQVPVRARSLIFIYQGKQLVKPMKSNSRRLDLQLNSEEMTYPSRPESDSGNGIDSVG